ncbi:MAG: hypothetical protein HC837_15320, partial [Chloroflexaceae bacterium]|nr:hypothetical protein [Chloroflexaceae bacterium]
SPASSDYLDTLAHEFQHMIHWNEQRQADVWLNEGCATLSENLNGFSTQSYALSYLRQPDTQLTNWVSEPWAAMAHYGAANLFLRYVYAQYIGAGSSLNELIRADAGSHFDAFVPLAAARYPDISSFNTIFGDWAVANLLDDPTIADGRYAYPPLTDGTAHMDLPQQITPEPIDVGTFHGSVHQFGVDYLQLPTGPVNLTFQGDTDVLLVGSLPADQAAWWSGRGDSSVATLTRAFDFRELTSVTLELDLWYELEPAYDYAFVSISSDAGQTWQTLPGQLTTTNDPQGANYGNGITGISGEPDATPGSGVRGIWVQETMDLSAYAGQEVLLRFWQINDEGFHAPGLLIDRIRIPELGYDHDGHTLPDGWQAAGFVPVDGTLPQQWELRLVRTLPDGRTQVEPLRTNDDGSATVALAAGEQGVLLIAGVTPHTSEQTSYTVTIAAPDTP